MLLAPPSRVVGVKAWLNAAHDDKRRTERAAARPKEGLGAGVADSNAIVLDYGVGGMKVPTAPTQISSTDATIAGEINMGRPGVQKLNNC